MTSHEVARRLIASRATLTQGQVTSRQKIEAEGGCGVIGVASSEKIAGRHLLSALVQMRNRGNGKGGGIAAVGLNPDQLGVTPNVLENDYLLAIAYLEPEAQHAVERSHIHPLFEVDHVHCVNASEEDLGLAVRPPAVTCYFVRPKPQATESFQAAHGLLGVARADIEDELVYQNTYRLNREYYASAGEKRAFVLSHGKNMLVLKMVGYGDDVVRYYRLADLYAHVWIGHHRYPTKGRVWHPGGAHPFVGLQEALVHNGDFANYASICEYLAQRNLYPLFLTDTEVAVLVFDLLHRTYRYPLEYVIEALAPTTERDFALLPPHKRQLYDYLQAMHIHGSPDGPWFFLVAQSKRERRGEVFKLIGITDTSMLRPQVFALHVGEREGDQRPAIGFAASEKQAIDAALESLAAEDDRYSTHADRYWNARGGSHTDGGAFCFTVASGARQPATLECTDKFGHALTVAIPPERSDRPAGRGYRTTAALPDLGARELFLSFTERLPQWDYDDVSNVLHELARSAAQDCGRARAIELLTLLFDRCYDTGSLRRSRLLGLYDRCLATLIESVKTHPTRAYVWTDDEALSAGPQDANQTAVVDARGYAPEGERSLAKQIVRLYQGGYRKFIIAHTRGHRFIANGLGPATQGVRLDVYGSSGDYLASGIDGCEIYVHGSGQDQLAQIMKEGKLVVYGDVGQTFMYAAKGGQAYVLGNAAGRPLINAVGKPRVVINGTCLDYLAESFMAGDPLSGGGFVIVNGIGIDDRGQIAELDTPYPGGNLFSLASGGAIYIRDPHGRVTEAQLNGGEFAELTDRDWLAIEPYLRENEDLFRIPVRKLLEVNGEPRRPGQVYRKIWPRALLALQAEEAWVRRE